MKLLVVAVHLFIICGFTSAQSLNVADPAKHPFADSKLGRDGYELASEEVNSFRLYDFYSRQADFYLQNPVPRFVPAYPGLEAGEHGHWGKYNQNNHSDDRWNEQLSGSMVGGRLNVGKTQIHKAINLKLGDAAEISACFDPWTMTYRYVWSGGFIKYDGYRWGTSRGLKVVGDIQFQHHGVWNGNNPQQRIDNAKYHGVYRNGARVVLAYSVGRLEVFDAPWAYSENGVDVWTRQLKYTGAGGQGCQLPLVSLPKDAKQISSNAQPGGTTYVFAHNDDRWVIDVRAESDVQVATADANDSTTIALTLTGDVGNNAFVTLWRGTANQLSESIDVVQKASANEVSIADLVAGTSKPQWPEVVTASGELSQADGAYVVDTIPVPFENPYRSVMMLSGIDFLPNGEAMVCTLAGDVWRVSGLDDELENVTWKRFAAGLAQPFGIKYFDGQLYVLAKDRLHILLDSNHDGEADFYKNYDNSWVETHGHTHVFGLDCDREGNFYFPAFDLFYKLPTDGSGVQLIAKGFRNCMGVAVSDDGLVLAAPQEGTWTPASMIIEVREREHYGFQRADEPVSSPMCFIPRGVDNSTGGMVFVDSDRWGPLGKSLIGLSYGYGSHYLILRDESVPRAQGATVPLTGEFLAGINRGRINPSDGQLYVVGTDGWGNYALRDGCLQRVRYTGRPLCEPIGFQVHGNGLRIDFTDAVDPEVAADPGNYFAQQWNYEHSKRYGSPEFSVFRPHMLGHDRVNIKSVQVLNGGKSVFLEIPRIVPCYQMHVRMHLTAADGHQFKTDIFPTLLSLGERFEFDGAALAVPGRATELTLRVREQKEAPLKYSNPKLKIQRTVTVNAVTGIRYDRTTLVAHAGAALEIKLRNMDGMPHNLVVVQPGAYEKVGQLSFKMLNDPAAFDNHYVPDAPEIVTHTRVVFPNETSSTKFVVPQEPGAYPFLCTFPGHWQTMRGQLIVVPKDQQLPDPNSLSQQNVTLASQLEGEDPGELIAAARANGNVERGAALFYTKKVSCSTCHDPSSGIHLGPKLFERHDKTNDQHLLEAILHPSKSIRKGYEPVIVMTFDGRMRAGVRVSEDEESVTIRDLTAGGKVLKYRKEDLDELMPSKVSMMPAGLVNNLNGRQQFLDLLSFVFAVAEGGKARLQQLRSAFGEHD